MKKSVVVFLLLSILAVAALATNFETKVLSDYKQYVNTFDQYMSIFEKTGKLSVTPSSSIQKVVYTIVSELEPAAYYRWIRIRSFKIPSGAIGNFPNINMQYIAKDIYERYKTADPVENVSLSAFLVYVVGTLYRENVEQTDFPKSPTFTEAVFDLNTQISNAAADVAKAYIQKSIGASGKAVGNFSYSKVDLKKILLSSLQKAYNDKVPTEIEKAVEDASINVPSVENSNANDTVTSLALESLTQEDVNSAIEKFKSNISRAFDNSARMIKLFASPGKTPKEAVERGLASLSSTLKIQEMLSSNVVKRDVSKRFNDRMFKLERSLAGQSARPAPWLFWRWLAYAAALIAVLFIRPKAMKYTLFAILAFEGIVLLFGVDPLLNRFDSTMYGFIVVTTAFLSILSWFHVFSTKKILFILSSSAVVVLFIAMLFAPLYTNLPSTKMSKNDTFMKSVYLNLYENELYGANGILTYHLNNLNSNLVSLRLDPYNFTTQTLSSYLTTIKKAGAFKGVIQYPSALRINVDRNSKFFEYENAKESMKNIKVVNERAQATLEDMQKILGLIKMRENLFAQTLDGIYTFAAPSLREQINKSLEKKISSSYLKEISPQLDGIMKKADVIPESAPTVHFFQTREGSKLFIIVSLLLLSVTFFGRNWIYRFTMSLITIVAAFLLITPKAVEFFVEYGFPTYSHILQNGESSNKAMIFITIGIAIFVAFEALHTRLSGIKKS
ncbi:hypothetical protein [Mesoaciditoga lauensis]|uniref:hypothetical protein n=1 Tax=Mesoaciditoga lauensis TaxID=1495039 RepID=UPI000563B8ED|nr:hypothetical protein [Mesoaciditoga lauensis]